MLLLLPLLFLSDADGSRAGDVSQEPGVKLEDGLCCSLVREGMARMRVELRESRSMSYCIQSNHVAHAMPGRRSQSKVFSQESFKCIRLLLVSATRIAEAVPNGQPLLIT